MKETKRSVKKESTEKHAKEVNNTNHQDGNHLQATVDEAGYQV